MPSSPSKIPMPVRPAPRYVIATCHHHHPSLDEIYPGLFLGNLAAAESPQHLTKAGITHIISITSTPPNLPTGLGIAKKYFELHDDHKSDLLSILPECVDRIEYILSSNSEGKDKEEDGQEAKKETERKEKRVLVHCCMGKSRSGGVVVGYVMKRQNCSVETALEYVTSKRGIVKPNSYFMAQLRLWGMSGFNPWCIEELKAVKEGGTEGIRGWTRLRRRGIGLRGEEGVEYKGEWDKKVGVGIEEGVENGWVIVAVGGA